jgi:hypothetical protein
MIKLVMFAYAARKLHQFSRAFEGMAKLATFIYAARKLRRFSRVFRVIIAKLAVYAACKLAAFT